MPYHWGRFRGLADMLGRPALSESVMGNVFFDTCVYHQPGINLLFDVIDIDNMLFGSEMVGAVRGIDPQTGHHFDDTRRYVEAAYAKGALDDARGPRSSRGTSAASTPGSVPSWTAQSGERPRIGCPGGPAVREHGTCRQHSEEADEPLSQQDAQAPEGYAWTRFGQPEYTDWLDESLSWKQTCYIGDWSFLWDAALPRAGGGPAVLRHLGQQLREVRHRPVQARHALQRQREGHPRGHPQPGRARRSSCCSAAARSGPTTTSATGDYNAESEEPDDWFNLQVSGPTAVHVVEKAAGERCATSGSCTRRTIDIAGHEVRALRQGMAGEIGYELQGPRRAQRRRSYDAVARGGAGVRYPPAGRPDGDRSTISRRASRRSSPTTSRPSSTET